MASVTSLGAGSGIDLQSLVDGLVAAESQLRLGGLDLREAQATERISAFGLLKSAVSLFDGSLASLGDIATFRSRTATSSNEDAFSVSASENAGLGSYAIEVLAEGAAQSLIADSLVDVTNTAIANGDTAIGGGTLVIQQGTEPSFLVEINSVSSSINAIAAAINSAEGNTGIQATVINADTGPVLVLNSAEVGTGNTINVTVDDIDGNDTDAIGLSQLTFNPADIPGSNLVENTAAADAQISVNGLVVTSTTSNVFADVVDGVTITALAATTQTETAEIRKDASKAVGAVNEFIESFNSLIDTVDDLGRGSTEEGAAAGILVGDSVLRSLTSQLRRIIFTAIDESQPLGVRSLSDIGISFTREGRLTLDSGKLNDLLDTNFDDVARLLAADGNPIAQNNALRTAGFATPASAVGDGQLSITVGEASFTVDILAAANTLADVRDAINNAAGNTTVNASIVLVDDGLGGTEAQLVLAATTAGQAIEIAVTDNDGNDTDAAGLSLLATGNLVELTNAQLDAPEGIILRLQSVLDSYIGATGEQGIIDARTAGLNADIRRIQDDRVRQELRLENFEARLVQQFSALDLLVANLQSSGEFLLSQLNAASAITLNRSNTSSRDN